MGRSPIQPSGPGAAGGGLPYAGAPALWSTASCRPNCSAISAWGVPRERVRIPSRAGPTSTTAGTRGPPGTRIQSRPGGLGRQEPCGVGPRAVLPVDPGHGAIIPSRVRAVRGDPAVRGVRGDPEARAADVGTAEAPPVGWEDGRVTGTEPTPRPPSRRPPRSLYPRARLTPIPGTVEPLEFSPIPDIRLIACDMDGTLLDDDDAIHDDFWPLIDAAARARDHLLPGQRPAVLQPARAVRADRRRGGVHRRERHLRGARGPGAQLRLPGPARSRAT